MKRKLVPDLNAFMWVSVSKKKPKLHTNMMKLVNVYSRGLLKQVYLANFMHFRETSEVITQICWQLLNYHIFKFLLSQVN